MHHQITLKEVSHPQITHSSG